MRITKAESGVFALMNPLEVAVVCLVQAMLAEGPSSLVDNEFREMVARTAINRIELAPERYSRDLCTVIWQASQFAVRKRPVPLTGEAFEAAYTLAENIFLFHHGQPDPTHGALCFHRNDELPAWALKNAAWRTVVYADHSWYSRCD